MFMSKAFALQYDTETLNKKETSLVNLRWPTRPQPIYVAIIFMRGVLACVLFSGQQRFCFSDGHHVWK